MDTWQATIGCNIATWRKRKGMTQRQLAEAIGKNPLYVSQIENAYYPNKAPSLETIARIAFALGIRPSAIVRGLQEEQFSEIPK